MNLIVPNWIIILMYATVTLLTIPRNKKFALIATELAGCGQKGQVCGSAPRPTSLLVTARGHKTNSHKPEWSPSILYLPHITTPEIIPVESRTQVDTMVNLGSDLQQVTSMGRNKTHNIHNVTDGQEISSGALETSDAGKTDNALGTYWKRVGTNPHNRYLGTNDGW